MAREKCKRHFFRLLHRHATLAHAFGQTRSPVMSRVPFVHCRQDLVRLVYRQHRAFRNLVQIAVRDDRSDLDDVIAGGVETGHFQVDPDQMVSRERRRSLAVSSHTLLVAAQTGS